MLDPKILLLNKIKRNGTGLYPSEKERINKLSVENTTFENFKTISAYWNNYQTDVIKTGDVIAKEQKWTSARIVDLQALQNTLGLGGLTQLLESRQPGGSLSLGQNIQNMYVTMNDTSDDETVSQNVLGIIGYELSPSDYKLEIPIADLPEYKSFTIKNPYLTGVVYIHPVVDDLIKVLPGVSIGTPTYASASNVIPNTKLTLMEIIICHAFQHGWGNELTPDELEIVLEAARQPYILYDNFAMRYDSGTVRYNSVCGCYFPNAKIGFSNLDYVALETDLSDYIDFIDIENIEELNTVTVPGFYRIKSQFIYKYWLMVDNFDTPNKDLFNLYSTKLLLNEKELGYRVNGMGDFGTPDPTYKYRGYYSMDNLLIHDTNINIRRIGE